MQDGNTHGPGPKAGLLKHGRRWRKVVVAGGHMVDGPDRPVPRFPPGAEAIVRQRLDDVLGQWQIGPEDLVLTQGARGADILAAELTLARQATVRLMLPLPEEEFIEASVRLPNSDWEERFRSLRRRCETRFQYIEMGALGPGQDVFVRNNLWCLQTASKEAGDKSFCVLLVWDECASEDGPGGTCHMAREAARLHAHIHLVSAVVP